MQDIWLVFLFNTLGEGVRWRTPLISALGEKGEDCGELEGSLG